MSEIRSEADYLSRFLSVRTKAWQQALDIRKFEIDLYWKRAAYFWALIAASFTGYFVLESSANATANSFTPLVACVGFLLSLAWYLVNRGSKYWQENWERHVDLLEDSEVGPLYKTTISSEEFPWFRFWKGYPYSVSRVNQLTSLFVAIIWFGIVIGTLPRVPGRNCFLGIWPWLLLGLTAIFSVFLFTLGKSSGGGPRRINFQESSLERTGPGAQVKVTADGGTKPRLKE
jgi:hypothetical protein